MKTLIQNVTVINPDNTVVSDVLFGETILKIRNDIDPSEATEVIDGTGKFLMPSLIDPHVHFRDPGFEHKEDFYTGTCSAAAGGVGAIFDMPNTNPPTFTCELLDQKRAIVDPKAVVDYGLYFGANEDNASEIAKVQNVPGVKMYLNTTTGNLKMDDPKSWTSVFGSAKKVSLHAEGDTFVKAVELWRAAGMPCELHLCHMSLQQEVELIRELKKDPEISGKISCEVCPHHLLMTWEERKKHGAFCCMKPPLAEASDVEALWRGIEDGTIDFFATDHAPHTRAEKEQSDIDGVPVYGIPGVESLFPLMFTEFKKRGWSMEKLVSMTSTNIISCFHITNKSGKIEKGLSADMVLFDPEASKKISGKNSFSKCDWTPYEGYESALEIEATFVRGTRVFDGQKITAEKGFGKELWFEE